MECTKEYTKGHGGLCKVMLRLVDRGVCRVIHRGWRDVQRHGGVQRGEY